MESKIVVDETKYKQVIELTEKYDVISISRIAIDCCVGYVKAKALFDKLLEDRYGELTKDGRIKLYKSN